MQNLLSDPYFLFYSNSSHVFQGIQNFDKKNFVQNYLRNNHTKFHPNPFSSFREDFFQNVNGDNRDQVMVIAHMAYGQLVS